MRIVAIGLDLVAVPRIADLLGRHGGRFLARVFTPDEAAYALRQAARNDHLAARFAAKEAVLKALGTGWSGGIAWTDVEVVRGPSGVPAVRLTGQAAAVASRHGITEWRLSLTHTGGFAAAIALAISQDG